MQVDHGLVRPDDAKDKLSLLISSRGWAWCILAGQCRALHGLARQGEAVKAWLGEAGRG